MEIFGIPLPEELQQEIDKRHMEAESFRHDIARFLDELSQDQLFTLRRLLTLMQADSAGMYASYLEGASSAILQYKHGVCAGCGKDHMQEILPMPETQPASVTPEPEKMEEYNLKFDLEGRIVCANCGYHYPSVADRMLRPPGKQNCPGCVHKEKWG